MFHLRLAKGISYTGIVSATRENPDVYVEDKEAADKAVETGYFTMIGEEPDKGNAGGDGEPDSVDGALSGGDGEPELPFDAGTDDTGTGAKDATATASKGRKASK